MTKIINQTLAYLKTTNETQRGVTRQIMQQMECKVNTARLSGASHK